ncbi:MAG: SGNH/GDSL hydrolase family protein [Caldilineaceae bacterium]
MTQAISAADSRLHWAGATSLDKTDDGVMPWRLHHRERTLYALPLVERAAMPAGVRIVFRSDTTSLGAALNTWPERAPLDVVCDGALIATVETADRASIHVDGLPAGDKQIELWLPQFGELRLSSLQIDDGATLAAATPDHRPRWITYGSSITQCRTAASPTQTWPAIVARTCGYDLTCLGFGGQCHLDMMIARQMRDAAADYLSMCVGINIYGGGTLNPRTFGPSIIGFVQIVREKHPDTPFVVMSPIFSPPREDVFNSAGFTLRAMRDEVQAAVTALQAHGDRNVHYIDGLTIFGPESAHLLPDDLHPDAKGYQLMGKILWKR